MLVAVIGSGCGEPMSEQHEGIHQSSRKPGCQLRMSRQIDRAPKTNECHYCDKQRNYGRAVRMRYQHHQMKATRNNRTEGGYEFDAPTGHP